MNAKIIIFLVSVMIITFLGIYEENTYATEITLPQSNQSDFTFSVIVSRIKEIQDRLSNPTLPKGERDVLEQELEMLKGLLSHHIRKGINKTD
ncbi:MAG: hypothetical protein N3A62_06655 [Thermodesulfovibrionales bacterium]|nr:hypothetical protein [Thermodesulfovibrionales bacterium]